MLIKQLSVFLEDRSGRLTELTRILAENDVNIIALSVAETADYGIVRMVTGRPAGKRGAGKGRLLYRIDRGGMREHARQTGFTVSDIDDTHRQQHQHRLHVRFLQQRCCAGRYPCCRHTACDRGAAGE